MLLGNSTDRLAQRRDAAQPGRCSQTETPNSTIRGFQWERHCWCQQRTPGNSGDWVSEEPVLLPLSLPRIPVSQCLVASKHALVPQAWDWQQLGHLPVPFMPANLGNVTFCPGMYTISILVCSAQSVGSTFQPPHFFPCCFSWLGLLLQAG